MGIICERRRRQKAQLVRRRLMIAAGITALCAAAMTPQIGEKLAGLGKMPVFAQGSAQMEMVLPQREIYALQLAVFDSGERAQDEAQRLAQENVRCIVWQRDKMRLVCSVALSREGLKRNGIGDREAYVIKEVLPKVSLRLTCGAEELIEAQNLLETPDRILMHLLTGEAGDIGALIADTRSTAEAAGKAHPENLLYTQLAQSLVNWCSLMDNVMRSADEEAARSYAALTMCTLCRELRTALHSSGEAG